MDQKDHVILKSSWEHYQNAFSNIRPFQCINVIWCHIKFCRVIKEGNIKVQRVVYRLQKSHWIYKLQNCWSMKWNVRSSLTYFAYRQSTLIWNCIMFFLGTCDDVKLKSMLFLSAFCISKFLCTFICEMHRIHLLPKDCELLLFCQKSYLQPVN